ncbi:FHA domain-containing protein [Verrucomicrobiaceae bacterium R5-34]|uniref:FHA domain-containing protein n=1 Tax=Oceaniferula flava TaxID=2800421 RepID=A0AAE2SDG4_9BACT|nr:FHA domain-containing protein [Oceaniferula flavus]MBK1830253.1 FHA domain-containing protein [Verrucomicrobiaceae bacterium R5-34]MBK1854844.1 FHA domain-containing protein [Oceaniferula flavus]MBM1136150.1 FHA domain-containing protein [Oceaniferula flavus]
MPRVTISEPGKTPQPYRFKLERKTIDIGRGSDNDIVVECGSVSTKHSVMERIEGGYILRDNGSTNGIKLDDTLMDIIDLFDGMEVLVGDIPLKFELSKEEISVLSDEEFTSHQRRKLPKINDDAQEAPHRETRPATTSSPRANHRPHQPVVVQQSGGGFKTLMTFILMIVAVFAGMSLRHYKETNEFLLPKLMGGAEKSSTQESETPEEEAEPAAEE